MYYVWYMDVSHIVSTLLTSAGIFALAGTATSFIDWPAFFASGTLTKCTVISTVFLKYYFFNPREKNQPISILSRFA